MTILRRTTPAVPIGIQAPPSTPAATGKPVNSGKPTFVVIDAFEKKTSDVNGDGTADVSHGEFVSRLIQSKASEAGKDVSIVRVEKNTLPQAGPVLPGASAPASGSRKAFEDVTAMLKRGDRIDGINFSGSMTVPLYDASGKQTGNGSPTPENLAASVYPNDAAKQKGFIARGNSGTYTATDRADVKAFYEKELSSTTGAYKEMLAEASKRNIPVTVSSGNEPNQLNPYTLFEPTIAVGSTGKNGITSGYTSKSTQNDTFAKGELNHKNVIGGIDVTGDGKADFKNRELSRGSPMLSKVLGKSYQSVKASEANYQQVAKYFSDRDNLSGNGPTPTPKVEGKVFDMQKLTSMMKTEASKSQQPVTDKGTELGQVYRNMYGVGSTHLTFTADPNLGIGASPVNIQNGKVVVDVEGTGGKNVVTSSQGTSWAAPIKLVDLVLKQQKSW